MVAAGAHLDREGRSSSQPLTHFQQPSSENWHPRAQQQPSSETSSEESSGSSLAWQPYPASTQHQNGPPPFLPPPPHHMAPQHPPPPPLTQAGNGAAPPHPMATMHHHPWQGHLPPPPPHMGATFPPTHAIPHAYLMGGCYPPPPPGYYPPPPVAYPMYLVAVPPPLPEQHPASAPPQKQQQRPANNSSSKYPGKHVRPLREVWPAMTAAAAGHPPPPPHNFMNGFHHHHHPPTRPLPPSELCVPTLLSPLRNKRPRPVGALDQPWAVLHDLQQQHAHPIPEAKVAWYSQMNREWHAVLEQQNQREEILDFDRLHVILTCLMDRDPCNYTNLGLALTSLQKLTATEHQRAQITSDEEAIKIYQAMIKLVEWPVASRVLGAANIANVFSVLVALLEDARLRATAKADLLSKLSTVSASIWILWKSDETIVALARRALVAINPHYDSEDDEDEDESEDVTENDDHCSRTESPLAGVQDTLPASVSADNSVEWTVDGGSRDVSGAICESPEPSKGPLPWTTTNQVHDDTKHPSSLAWSDKERNTEVVHEAEPRGYIPRAEGGYEGYPGGSSSAVSSAANQELDFQERSVKRQCLRDEQKEASYVQ